MGIVVAGLHLRVCDRRLCSAPLNLSGSFRDRRTFCRVALEMRLNHPNESVNASRDLREDVSCVCVTELSGLINRATDLLAELRETL